jgi:hypothetical protein
MQGDSDGESLGDKAPDGGSNAILERPLPSTIGPQTLTSCISSTERWMVTILLQHARDSDRNECSRKECVLTQKTCRCNGLRFSVSLTWPWFVPLEMDVVVVEG